MRYTLLTLSALALAALAAPISNNEKRQCYFNKDRVQICNPTPNCYKDAATGTVVCVSKREAELEKRQCWITQDGEQHCNDTPNCFTDEVTGDEVCVLKRSEVPEKRQCYADETGEHCIDNPTCYAEPDGTEVCVD